MRARHHEVAAPREGAVLGKGGQIGLRAFQHTGNGRLLEENGNLGFEAAKSGGRAFIWDSAGRKRRHASLRARRRFRPAKERFGAASRPFPLRPQALI